MQTCKQVVAGVAALMWLSQGSVPAQPPSAPYHWRNVVIGGGGFVTGIVFHPRERNLLYARTDVGGAYRWDAAAQRWIPLTDWVRGVDFTGIESLAVDPNDANRVYLAAGIYRWTRAAILRSDDRGQTWQVTEVPFKMGGNEAGRFNGERLAVDPNDGQILFFGSRHDGLWKSADRGATWRRLENFPQTDTTESLPAMARANGRRFRFNFAPPEIGIVFALFDPRSGVPGAPTPVVYAGASSLQTNFFRSDDGGAHWQAVPGQPLGLRPNHAAFSTDGNIYLTYGRQAGPNSMTDGAVWKFHPQTGAWTDITPLRPVNASQPFGYGAVAADAQRPGTIVVTTFCRWHPHDEIFRSTNGGASWTPLLDNALWDYSQAPYTAERVPHWMGSVQIDPFDSNHILFTTGYGIWSCTNLTDADAGKPTRWEFTDAGLEETVPLALISPPEGAHLLSGLGDIDGFRHDNLNASPAQGTFRGPRFSNTEDLAFAAKYPFVIVRTGTGKGDAHAAISHDGGKSWTALAGDPPDAFGAGAIAISADAKIIVWTTRRDAPNLSTDCGTDWTPCAGLAPGLRVVADPVDPLRFYAFNPEAGRIFASTNGAADFLPTGATLPANAESAGGRGTKTVTLSATPDRTGDLWLTLRDNGLWHSTDGGATFDKLENVSAADSLGFGKAADGEHFPALYLAGRIENVQGLFRSIDGGTTWARINDNRHQYGIISHVTGDPRIFGRVYFATSGRGIIYGDEIVK